MIGGPRIASRVRLPDLSVHTVPYPSYPGWVVDHSWDMADFVAVERPRFWTTEGIYDSLGITQDVRDSYLTGVQSTLSEPDYKSWPVDFRGEFNPNLHDQPWLYFSSVDHTLHLLRAQSGLWKFGDGREIRYGNLGVDYLNKWTLVENGKVTKSLAFVGDQLVLADGGGVRVKAISVLPARFTALPPTSHDTWTRLRDLIKQNQASFAPNDFETMFNQFSGPVQEIPGAVLSHLRAIPNGFRFALQILAATPPGVAWTSGLQPGAYLVHYQARGGYSVEPLRPATPRLSPVTIIGQRPTALQPVVLETTVQNLGNDDSPDLPIRFTASRAGQPAREIGLVTISVPADGSVRARISWTPPSSGEWVIQASTTAGGITSAPVELAIAPPPPADLANLLVVSRLRDRVLAIVAMVLGTVVLFAGALGVFLWRSNLEPHRQAGSREADHA